MTDRQRPGGSGRRRTDADATDALRRMFEPPPPAQRDQAVHAAVMAGFDHLGGPSTAAPAGVDLDHRDGDPVNGAAGNGAPAAYDGVARNGTPGNGTAGNGAHGNGTEEHVEVPATLRHDGRDLDDDGELDDELMALATPRSAGFNPLAALGRSLNRGLAESGEMVWLAGSALKSAITRPKGYWGETKEQIYNALKLCWVPMVVSITAFGIGAPGLQGGNTFTIFGVPEREGSFIVATGIREFAPWIDAMIVAGVVGTAITADIGARRIREEIDAMEVLGVDPLRELVLPRIISTAIITGLFDIVALLVGVVGGYIASVLLLGASTSGYESQFYSQANVADLLGSFAKTFLFGAIVGVVCCYKGLRASGGPSGVGKAVNQAVVISFALIWTVNYVFTNTLLGFAPSTQTFH